MLFFFQIRIFIYNLAKSFKLKKLDRMLKLKKLRFILFASLLSIFVILLSSCSTPNNGAYRKRGHVGSSSYYQKGSSYRNKSKRNVIPIAKNYRIKNRRTSGNY